MSLYCFVRSSLANNNTLLVTLIRTPKWLIFSCSNGNGICIVFFTYFLSVTQAHWSMARVVTVCQQFYTHHATPFTQNYRICFATVFLLIINWQCVLEMYSKLQQTTFFARNKTNGSSNPQRDFNRNCLRHTIASRLNGIRTHKARVALQKSIIWLTSSSRRTHFFSFLLHFGFHDRFIAVSMNWNFFFRYYFVSGGFFHIS